MITVHCGYVSAVVISVCVKTTGKLQYNLLGTLFNNSLVQNNCVIFKKITTNLNSNKLKLIIQSKL